jgi:single-strand DNA-binding protein
MKNINCVTLNGRLVADPELKFTSGNKAIVNFCIAVNDDYGETKNTYFIKCFAWEKLAETINKYFKKGREIFLVGSLKQDKWEDKEGKKRTEIKILVKEFNFGSSSAKESTDTESQPESESQPTAADYGTTEAEIPF